MYQVIHTAKIVQCDETNEVGLLIHNKVYPLGGAVTKPLTYDFMPYGYPRYDVELQTIIEESVTTTTLANGFHRGPMNQYDDSLGFGLNQTYDIVYNGVTYTRNTYAFGGIEDYSCIGNSALGQVNGADTGEPFLIVQMGRYWLYYTAEPGDHTFELKEHVTVPVPMAEEFLPDGIDVTSWNDLTDKPFYDETPVLYEGYPEYAWGYAKLPFVLRGGVSYEVCIVYPDVGTATTIFSGEPVVDDGFYTISKDYSDDEYEDGDAFRLEHNEGDSYSYFYPDGNSFSDRVMVRVRYANDEDAGSVPLPERFMPLLTSPNGTKYKITVADDGTLSAVAE